MLSLHDVGLKQESCELPSGDNLRHGDVVHLRATFQHPLKSNPKSYGVFTVHDIGDFLAPFAEIVDVELPPLKIGDRVVTPDGTRGTVVVLRHDGAHISLGTNGWGEHTMAFHNIDTLTRRD